MSLIYLKIGCLLHKVESESKFSDTSDEGSGSEYSSAASEMTHQRSGHHERSHHPPRVSTDQFTREYKARYKESERKKIDETLRYGLEGSQHQQNLDEDGDSKSDYSPSL